MPLRYRELWTYDADENAWHCAGRLDEPAAMLNGVWDAAVVPALLMRFIEQRDGSGAAECLWNKIAESWPNDKKEAAIRSIVAARDCDVMMIVPPAANMP